MTDFRLIASDLDGTVVDPRGRISPFTKRVLRAVEESGRSLVFVTGRPPRWMAPIVEESGHRGVAICANGAVVMDLHTEEVLHSRSLDATQSMLAVNRLREVLPEVTFAVERIGAGRRADVEFGREPTYVPRWPTPDHPPLAPVEELVAEGGVIKILARIPQAEHAAIDGDDDRPAHARALGPDPTRNIPAAPLVDALLAKAAAALVGVASVTHSNPNDTLLEVSALGATKAVALATHVESLGVASHEVVAVSLDRKSTRLNSSHEWISRMPSSA